MVCTRERVDTRRIDERCSAYEQVVNTGVQARAERSKAHRRTAEVVRTSGERPRHAPTEIDHAPRDERRTPRVGTGRVRCGL